MDEEGGVTNPGNTDFALADFGKVGQGVIAGTLGEKRRDQDLGKKIALVPIRTRDQPDTGRTLIFGAVLRGWANDVPPAFFRKRNRHGGASI